MSTLRICLFGNVRLTHTEWKAEVKITRANQRLLSFFLLNRHRLYPREALAGIFWGEHSEAAARRCLRTALCRLRKVLKPDGVARGTYLIATPQGEVGFTRERTFWLDVAVFEEIAARCLAMPFQDAARKPPCELENILELYTGDLLEGFYDDWAIRERERLRSLYLKCLAHLMHFYRFHRNYDRSLACGHYILNHDSLREEIHREMMRLYVKCGRRASAILQYQTCRRILETELDVPPMEETEALYRRIQAGSGDLREEFVPREGTGATAGTRSHSIEQAIEKLSTAMQNFGETQEQIHQSKRLLEQTLKDP